MKEKEMLLRDVITKINGVIAFGNENEKITDVSTDTRTIKEGDTFIALKGDNNNGNEYLKTALENGAKICIVDEILLSDDELKKYKKSATLVQVKNGREALIELARYKRSLYDIPVVAITGSVGKTTTKDTIASVLSKKYKVLKTEGNFNNSVGLPLTILKLKDHEEISELTCIARPTISVISNIGTSHIGMLGSRENILKAKLEIIDGMNQDGILILNNDNDMLHNWNKKNHGIKTKTFGIENKSDVQGFDVEHFEESSKFLISKENQNYEITTSKPGLPFVMNSLSALAVGEELEVEINDMIDAIKNMEMTKNRMDIEKLDGDIILIKDYYNASYESIKPGLEYLMSLDGKRKIAILGDIKELGKFSKELHEKVGKEVVSQKVNILITVGEDAKYISKEAMKEGMDKATVFECDTNDEAVKVLNKIIKQNDNILLKASNSMKFDEIYKGFMEQF